MKVLLLEDSQRLLRSLERGLAHEGYAVDACADGAQGLELATAYDYDVIVLDLMLPGLPGLEVLRRLRQEGNEAHVLILSAKGCVEDRVQGLQLGADDYLAKPFSFDELCARLQALTRRHVHKNPLLSVGSLEIDTAGRTVRRDGNVVELTPSEYSILELLAYRRGQTFSQERLLERLRHSQTEVISNVVQVLISSLRRKIDLVGEPSLIKTRRGFGYVIE